MEKCSFTEILRLKVYVTIIYFVRICYFFIVNFSSFLFVEQKILKQGFSSSLCCVCFMIQPWHIYWTTEKECWGLYAWWTTEPPGIGLILEKIQWKETWFRSVSLLNGMRDLEHKAWVTVIPVVQHNETDHSHQEKCSGSRETGKEIFYTIIQKFCFPEL